MDCDEEQGIHHCGNDGMQGEDACEDEAKVREQWTGHRTVASFPSTSQYKALLCMFQFKAAYISKTQCWFLNTELTVDST